MKKQTNTSDTKTLKTLAETLLSVRELKTRANGDTFITYDFDKLEDLGEELQTCVRKAHLSEIPNDFTYSVIDTCLNYIVDENIESVENFQDNDGYYQAIENSVPVYNNQLVDWLGSDLSRAEYLNEHVKDCDAPSTFNLVDLIRTACTQHINSIYDALAQALNELAEEQNDESEETEVTA